MGWIWLIGLALFTGGLLALIGFPRRLWAIAATALTLGAAGYAWQGSPGLAGHPVKPVEERGEVDPGMIAMRDAIFGRFDFAYRYFGAADAMARIGAHDAQVKVMLAAVREAPRSAALWTGLGQALAEHDNGVVSPSARAAFDRAMDVAPAHPGPPFFLGLSLVRSGDFLGAHKWWVKAVDLTPVEASYRGELIAQLDRLDQFLAERGIPIPPDPDAPQFNESAPAPAE